MANKANKMITFVKLSPEQLKEHERLHSLAVELEKGRKTDFFEDDFEAKFFTELDFPEQEEC